MGGHGVPLGISLLLRVWIYLPETYAMNPASEDRDDVSDVASPPLASTSEVGYAQVPLSQNPSSSGDQWRAMFELQQQNMIKLIEAMKTPSVPVTTLPEFNPDSKDADARAWCSTVDICMAERPLEGGALIIALSKSLKGSALGVVITSFVSRKVSSASPAERKDTLRRTARSSVRGGELAAEQLGVARARVAVNSSSVVWTRARSKVYQASWNMPVSRTHFVLIRVPSVLS
ncbi:hypothetical protein ACJJTC_010473 [Scirpophaga incertulas]